MPDKTEQKDPGSDFATKILHTYYQAIENVCLALFVKCNSDVEEYKLRVFKKVHLDNFWHLDIDFDGEFYAGIELNYTSNFRLPHMDVTMHVKLYGAACEHNKE